MDRNVMYESRRGSVLTVDTLTKAILNSINDKNFKEEVARDIAQHIMNFFGYSDRVIDNMLEPSDRDAFYMLEDWGLLTTEREETTLYDGREWRIHYWLLRKDRIIEVANKGSMASSSAEKEDYETIYDALPDDVWSRGEEE